MFRFAEDVEIPRKIFLLLGFLEDIQVPWKVFRFPGRCLGYLKDVLVL
jgi:hypothetical protein